MDKILVLNAGSSTLKYKLFEVEEGKKLFEIKQGTVDRIGLDYGPDSHTMALSMIFQGIGYDKGLSGIPELVAIGHRVVHCGDEYEKTTKIDDQVIENLKKYNLLAPLHNPKILEVIEEVYKKTGEKGHRIIPNYAVFDSTYYKELPEKTKVYPLPYEYYEDYNIKRFGFHGISHQYVCENVLKRHPDVKNIISIHLGSGSSITAVQNKKPIDTSMGFTPLEGLMMVTRSGNIDSGIIHYLIERGYLKHKEVDHMLNFNSGMVGITGLRTDMTDFLNIAGYKVEIENFKPKIYREGLSKNQIDKVKLALDMYVYRIKKYIGAYNAILGGTDALIFTGKVGYGSSVIRDKVLNGLDSILDGVIIEAIETDEELQIAKEIIKAKK